MLSRSRSALVALAVIAGFASWGFCQSHMVSEVGRAPSHHAVHEGESHSHPSHGDGRESGSEDPCCLTLSAVVKTVDSIATAPESTARIPALTPGTLTLNGADRSIQQLNRTLKPPGGPRPLDLTCALLI